MLYFIFVLLIGVPSINALEEILEESVPAPALDSAQLIPAPPRIELDLKKDSVILEVNPNLNKNAQKNLGYALGLSALVPGSGEYYLRETKQAKIFWLAETGFWAALFFSFTAKEQYLQSAKNLASQYAGAKAKNQSEEFLELMSQYRSLREKENRQDSYEMAQLLSGKPRSEWIWSVNAENDWDFGPASRPQNTKNWQRFQSTLRYHRAAKQAITYGLGALALNRIASLVNVLHLYRSTSGKGLAFQIGPEWTPQRQGAWVAWCF